MKKKILIIGIWLILIVSTWLTAYPQEIKALDSCSSMGYSINLDPGLPRRKNNVIVSGIPLGQDYQFEVVERIGIIDQRREFIDLTETGGVFRGELKERYSVQNEGTRKFFLYQSHVRLCEGTYSLPSLLNICSGTTNPNSITIDQIGTTSVYVKFSNIGDNQYYDWPAIFVEGEALPRIDAPSYVTDDGGTFYGTIAAGSVDWHAGTNKLILHDKFSHRDICYANFFVGPSGVTPTPGGPAGEFDPCAGDATEKCKQCLGWDDTEKRYTKLTEKVWTALGCLPTDPTEFVSWLLSAAIRIGGGIAFLLMIWGGFQIMSSSGNPEKLNQGKDILVSAGVGLLFIIFAVLLLKIIGIDIFQLPGWQE